LLQEYQIRLDAHRRELLEREAALERARREIQALRKARLEPGTQSPTPPANDKRLEELERDRRESRAEIARLRATITAMSEQIARPLPSSARDQARIAELEKSDREARAEIARLQARNESLEAQLRAMVAAAANRSDEDTERAQTARDHALVVSLQHELDVERDNRATLEREIARLVAVTRTDEASRAAARSLDDAQAQILLLNQRLAHEQRARESLEVAVARVQQIAAVGAADDWMDRFQASMNERREQSERLQEELHNANESIVTLRGKLEAAGPRPASTAEVDGLQGENKKLRDALQSAQQANADLRSQAELAARLAELLYGRSD
jgi:chromosome segregation ATPase